jgi:hypothetical protein
VSEILMSIIIFSDVFGITPALNKQKDQLEANGIVKVHTREKVWTFTMKTMLILSCSRGGVRWLRFNSRRYMLR